MKKIILAFVLIILCVSQIYAVTDTFPVSAHKTFTWAGSVTFNNNNNAIRSIDNTGSNDNWNSKIVADNTGFFTEFQALSMCFDTSSIPEGSVITAGRLNFSWMSDTGDNDSSPKFYTQYFNNTWDCVSTGSGQMQTISHSQHYRGDKGFNMKSSWTAASEPFYTMKNNGYDALAFINPSGYTKITIAPYIWNSADTAMHYWPNYVQFKKYQNVSISVTYTPPNPTIYISPSTLIATVGAILQADVVVNSDALPHNAASSLVSLSSNLQLVSISSPSVNACNLQYTKTPTVNDPSFAGAYYSAQKTASCSAYTMTILPTSSGNGTITLSNASIKAYDDNREILNGVTNGSITINNANVPVPELTIDSYFPNTYQNSATVSGIKYETITEVDINDSTSGVNLPTSTTWNSILNLAAGTNTFTLYGKDSNNNQTASQTITINKRTLGDINGDGSVTVADASLFAVDWGKSSNLIYNLSDMNNDGIVDLTDLSILAKLITP